jgi:hypothetical protein
MLFGKCATRGFQILLKLRSASSIRKRNARFQTPRAPFHRVENSARVMVFDSLAQVVRQAGIENVLGLLRFEECKRKKILA